MGRTASPFRFPVSASARAGLAALALVAAALGCSDRRSAFEPIPGPGPARVVAGQLRAGGGAALEGAVVTLEAMENGVSASVRARLTPSIPGVLGASRDAGGVRSTTTDAGGRFAFGDVAPGDYLVSGSSRDHLAGLERIHVGGGPLIAAETTFVDLDLTPTGDFYGVVTLEGASNHQSTIVYVDGTSYVAATNPSGGYRLDGVPIGSWTVRGTHPGYLDRSVSGALAMAGDSVGLASFELPRNTNMPPSAVATGPAEATVSTVVNFGGSASDADGSIVQYEWDFDDDGTFEYSSPTTLAASHTYATTGTYQARLVVTDDDGAIGVDVHTIVISSCATCVYVSTSTGNDGNPGTMASPVKTITQGLYVADSLGKTGLVIAVGTYNEAPVFLNGIGARGGHDPTTWNPNSGTTTVQVGTSPATANGITSATLIRDIGFVASSTVLLAKNSIALSSSASNASLQFLDCSFQSANAAHGTAGNPGPDGLPGQNGQPGNPGSCDGSTIGTGGAGGTSPVGCTGGAGGNGGAAGANPGTNGGSGLCAGTGGTGGNAGGGGDPGGDGQNGVPGGNGTPGNPGSPASPAGTISGGSWTPNVSGNGTDGANGRGGGGGGGGGGQGGGPFVDDGTGNGGGGGGGGGEGGDRGFGGQGGYASFAVYLFNSSPTFTNCLFRTGTAGTGGAGGNRGLGGGGGTGGSGSIFCQSEIGTGGNGGNGGAGGNGGSGAGGPGGPSYGLYKAGASVPSLSGASYLIGPAGSGGGGGTGASPGASGLSGNTN